MSEDEKQEIKPFLIDETQLKLGSFKNLLVYVSSIRNKAFNFLWFIFMSKKLSLMAQNWVTQVLSSLASSNNNFETFWYKILRMKKWCNSKNLCEFC